MDFLSIGISGCVGVCLGILLMIVVFALLYVWGAKGHPGQGNIPTDQDIKLLAAEAEGLKHADRSSYLKARLDYLNAQSTKYRHDHPER